MVEGERALPLPMSRQYPESMEKRVLKTSRLSICPVDQRHLEFLRALWNDPEVMQYAGFARNWGQQEMEAWYRRYLARLAKHGATEVQFICRLREGKLIGESGLGRLRRGWRCTNFSLLPSRLAVMTDVKLLKPFRNVEYGTETMKAITTYVFTDTAADALLVPPHRDNPPAIRMYEKAGFTRTAGIYYKHHMIYEMTRERFCELHSSDSTEE